MVAIYLHHQENMAMRFINLNVYVAHAVKKRDHSENKVEGDTVIVITPYHVDAIVAECFLALTVTQIFALK